VGDGEEGHVFDVRVVFGRVGDDVVDVVVSFPPADGEAAEEVGNEDTNAGVDVEVMGDTHMAGVMGGEDELVPEEAYKEAGESVLGVVEEEEGEGEDRDVGEDVKSVGIVRALVQTGGVDAGVQGSIFRNDGILRRRREGRIFEEVGGDLLSCTSVE